ncbi:MAG TPA: alpha/beta hydrolase [Stellaceae bacterium]|jgi:pimeloyl-ACP methyl ester carboxylesterase|nr:alpha/beta hydrolase [Stellaceae bacterium]
MAGESFREATIDADGFRIRYLEGGSGPVLICMHGGGGLRLAPAHHILARDYRVIAFEMPGFGKSENSRSTSTEDLARSMNAAVAALRVERYSLMGTSFGSKVALWMAIQRPEPLDAIVLISPAAIRMQEGPVPTHVSPEEGLKLLYAHPERQPKLTPPPRELMAKHAAFTSRLLGPPRDAAFEARLADVAIPVLVLFGTVDRVTPPEGAHLFREALPNCHIMFVYDAAHAIDADRPEALASVAGDFLARKGQFLVRQTSGVVYP